VALPSIHPRPPDPLALHDAQLVMARSFGFPSWPRLGHHLERVEPFAWDPSAGPPATARVDELIQWACLGTQRVTAKIHTIVALQAK
jgi:hypothetical protein